MPLLLLTITINQGSVVSHLVDSSQPLLFIMPVKAQQTLLEKGWSFKKTTDGYDAWKPVARVPTVAHIDLLNNGLFVPNFLRLDRN